LGVPLWTQQAYLKPLSSDAFDRFGSAVAVSGAKIVVGMPYEESNATGVNGDPYNNNGTAVGAAYVYVRTNALWTLRDYLKGSSPTYRMGASVGVDGDTVLVGAPFHDNSAGVVFVFEQTAPEIAIEQPLGVNIPDGGTHEFMTIGTNATNLIFTIKNIGNDVLTGLTITNDGPDSARFTIITNPTPPVAAGGSTPFTVRFTPQNIGTFTAALRIASNDKEQHPFDITLKGYSLSFFQDTDGDGLNDASELQLAPLGFNWRARQHELVNTLFGNLNGAISNLNAAGFYTLAQLQALNVRSPLMAKNPTNGLFTLTIGVEKATLLTNFVVFPMTSPQTTINNEGKLEFQFSPPDDAAFFRLESR